MFTKEENIYNNNVFKFECQKIGKRGVRSDIYNYINDNIKNNFHLILTMAPDKKNYTRFRNFTFLIKDCQLIYLRTWSVEAYQSVAKTLIFDHNELEIFGK